MSSLTIEISLREEDLTQTLGRNYPWTLTAEVFDPRKATDEVLRYLFLYGVRQQADAGAGSKSEAEFHQALSERFAKLAKGEVPKGGGGGGKADPVWEEYLKLVHAQLGCTKTQLKEWAKEAGRDPVALAMHVAVRLKGRGASRKLAERIAEKLMGKAHERVAEAEEIDLDEIDV